MSSVSSMLYRNSGLTALIAGADIMLKKSWILASDALSFQI